MKIPTLFTIFLLFKLVLFIIRICNSFLFFRLLPMKVRQ